MPDTFMFMYLTHVKKFIKLGFLKIIEKIRNFHSNTFMCDTSMCVCVCVCVDRKRKKIEHMTLSCVTLSRVTLSCVTLFMCGVCVWIEKEKRLSI